MYRIGRYNSDDRMCDLVCDNIARQIARSEASRASFSVSSDLE